MRPNSFRGILSKGTFLLRKKKFSDSSLFLSIDWLIKPRLTTSSLVRSLSTITSSHKNSRWKMSCWPNSNSISSKTVFHTMRACSKLAKCKLTLSCLFRKFIKITYLKISWNLDLQLKNSVTRTVPILRRNCRTVLARRRFNFLLRNSKSATLWNQMRTLMLVIWQAI